MQMGISSKTIMWEVIGCSVDFGDWDSVLTLTYVITFCSRNIKREVVSTLFNSERKWTMPQEHGQILQSKGPLRRRNCLISCARSVGYQVWSLKNVIVRRVSVPTFDLRKQQRRRILKEFDNIQSSASLLSICALCNSSCAPLSSPDHLHSVLFYALQNEKHSPNST